MVIHGINNIASSTQMLVYSTMLHEATLTCEMTVIFI